MPTAGPASAQSSPTGIWIDHTGRGAVEITECGANLCGRLVWLKDKANKKGCGVQIIGNARPVGKDTWDGGWILDPEKNAKYSVELKPIGADKLRVLGYMGSKLFSETMIWKRAATDLERCDATPTTTALPKPPPVDDTGDQGAGREDRDREDAAARQSHRAEAPRRQGQDRSPAGKRRLQALRLQEVCGSDRRDDIGTLREVGPPCEAAWALFRSRIQPIRQIHCHFWTSETATLRRRNRPTMACRLLPAGPMGPSI